MNVILNFSMRVPGAGACCGCGRCGSDSDERSKDLFQLRARATGAGGV